MRARTKDNVTRSDNVNDATRSDDMRAFAIGRADDFSLRSDGVRKGTERLPSKDKSRRSSNVTSLTTGWGRLTSPESTGSPYMRPRAKQGDQAMCVLIMHEPGDVESGNACSKFGGEQSRAKDSLAEEDNAM